MSSLQRLYYHNLLRLPRQVIKKIRREFDDSLAGSPVVLVDVGASGGTLPNFSILGKHLKTVGFEPDERAYAALAASKSENAVIINKALFRTPGEICFHVNQCQVTSSVLKSNHEFLALFPKANDYEPIKTIKMEAATLDDSLKSAGIADVDFIKIDTQGTELAILEGGRQTLANCFGVEIEVEFHPLYKDAPLFGEVDQFLRQQGFVLFDLRPVYWKRSIGMEYGKPKGQIVWGDALYFKDTTEFYKSINTASEPVRFQKTLRAVLTLALYGYLDYALELTGRLSGTVQDQDLKQRIGKLEQALKKKYFANLLPHSPLLRNVVAELFYNAFKIFRTGFERHSISGREIGNL